MPQLVPRALMMPLVQLLTNKLSHLLGITDTYYNGGEGGGDKFDKASLLLPVTPRPSAATHASVPLLKSVLLMFWLLRAACKISEP